MNRARSVLALVCLTFARGAQAADPPPPSPAAAARSLVERILPRQASRFAVEIIAAQDGADVFELESRGDELVLRGNSGVSVASALNWYLKYYLHGQVSWCGDNLPPSARLPAVREKVRRVSPYRHRAYLNYCTFGYTAPWWDWERWEREIDWMALHGINMPLAITGQEAVWQETLRRFKMNDEEIRSFLAGPAFLPWQWMANLEGWGGPLPQRWVDSHIELVSWLSG